MNHAIISEAYGLDIPSTPSLPCLTNEMKSGWNEKKVEKVFNDDE